MRKGIALLITIALVTTIATLIGISAGIVDKSYKRISNKQFLIQSNLFFSNLVEVLNSATQDLNNSFGLDIFLTLPLSFEATERNIAVDITFTSEAYAPNINSLIVERNSSKSSDEEPVKLNEAMEGYLERILSIYNVSDRILLLSLIADALDKDVNERVSLSEIALLDPFFMQGHIYNMQQFQKILDVYKRQTQDYSVDLIAWDKLIGFNNSAVDFNHISKEALYALMPSLSEGELQNFTTERVDVYENFDDLAFDEETQKTFKDLNVSFYVPNVKAKMVVHDDAQHVAIEFLYNIDSKKVSDIEITR